MFLGGGRKLENLEENPHRGHRKCPWAQDRTLDPGAEKGQRNPHTPLRIG